MEALGFSHVALTVTRWDKSKPFWEALLSYPDDIKLAHAFVET